MSNSIINFANAQTTINTFASYNQQVSGMSFAEASNALGGQASFNGARLVGFESQKVSQLINFPNANSAADAVLDYQASNGLATGANAAIASGKTISAGTVALCKSSELPVGVCGVATGGAGIAAAACAPIFGVALGYGLYEAFPNFWTRLSQKLLPWAYPDSGVIPFYYDAEGNTYLDAEMVQAVKQAMIEEGLLTNFGMFTGEGLIQPLQWKLMTVGDSWTDANGHTISIRGTGTATMFRCGVQALDGILYGCAINGNGGFFLFDETTQGRGVGMRTVAFTYANITSYVSATGISAGYVEDLLSIGVPECAKQPNGVSGQYVGWCMANNVPLPPEELPSVVEPWAGEKYPMAPKTIDIYTGQDATDNPTFKSAQKVALPIGDPLVTVNPETHPSPYNNPDPIEVPSIEPSTISEPLPLRYPAIDPYTNPYPQPNFFPREVPFEVPISNPAPVPSVENVPAPITEATPAPNVNPAIESAEPLPPNQPETAGRVNNGTTPNGGLPLVPLFPLGSDASLYHVYNPTQAQLDAFGGWLWQSFLDTLFDDLSRWFNNPMDAIIGLQEFYGTPNIQSTGTIRCGYLDSHIQSNIVGNRYGVINCGSIVVPEEYGNYLDYAPYTQVFVYLPFIGIMSLNADDVIGNAVNIKYHVDSYTGSCIAIITVARQGYEALVYQFEGNCSVDIPITGGQQTTLKNAIIGGISGAVMGGVAGAAIGAVVGGLSSKNDVQHSGSFIATHGAMGLKKPFIIVRRPVQKEVVNYNESYGYQAHKMVYIGNCRGYLRAREVRVLSSTATNEEKEMIVQALKSGVYVKN